MSIGILGGTFDPIHMGHLVGAEEARIRLELAQVLFIPAGQPWLKADRSISAIGHRVEMVRLAISSNPYFKLSTIEADRPGPSYSVDTLEELRRLDSRARFLFILGEDLLQELPQWRSPSRLIELCQLLVITRSGYPPPDLNSLEDAIPGISGCIIFLEIPQIDISSTQIRQRVARGLSIKYLVPESVEDYIHRIRLYLGD
jgi:nicotinate-nucleotide adenylyltransferase